MAAREPRIDAPRRVLVINGDPEGARSFVAMLRPPEFSAKFVSWADDVPKALSSNEPHAVLLDEHLPNACGLDVLSQLKQLCPHIPIIFLVNGGGAEKAIRAIQSGAFDCVRCPPDPGTLRGRLDEAFRVLGPNMTMESSPQSTTDPPEHALMGGCVAMQQVLKSVGRFARNDQPVLIEGEAGAGKEAVALAIHRHSHRSAEPFDVIYCPALTPGRFEKLLVEVLDAGSATAERFQNGTILLQEIAHLSLGEQTILLQWIARARESQKSQAFGNCRVICSTNRDLREHVEQGRFRGDLYYELAGQHIRVPALRDRREDLPSLVSHMLGVLRATGQIPPDMALRVAPEAMDVLAAYAWPGNLDELYSVLRRCLIEGHGNVAMTETLIQITRDHTENRGLGQPVSIGASTPRGEDAPWSQFIDKHLINGANDLYAQAVIELESTLLPAVLKHTQGNQSQAARILGITRASLRKKLRLQPIQKSP